MIRTYRVSGFLFLSLGFIREIFATHSDGVSPAGVGGCILLCILDCILFCIIIIILFILRFTLFYSLSHSYARLVVRTWRD
jgi:hypothetical protein